MKRVLLALAITVGMVAAPAATSAQDDVTQTLCVSVTYPTDATPGEVLNLTDVTSVVVLDPSLCADPSVVAGPVVFDDDPSTLYFDFLSHSIESNDSFVEVMDMGTSLDFEDTDALREYGETLQAWSVDLIAWLDDNPPDPCYAALHKQMGIVAGHYRKAASYFLTFVTRYEDGYYTGATKAIKASTKEMESGADALESYSKKLEGRDWNAACTVTS